ncbi:hypothetical protein [Clostridium sp. AF32-12BH]|uniref:hypothetical protein n=1 Tax=Clostridium sp. AF32-12BH TaxID=2292006 RepID=UPI000E507005|nr:hypothetical protein [Clostridium sp. AF32-12BH]RHP46433.1 hypothetical protein DWZ40_10365 [Clostridium sp. AF32-12BH]
MKREWNPVIYSGCCYALCAFIASFIFNSWPGEDSFFKVWIFCLVPACFTLFTLSSIYDFEETKDAYYESKLADKRNDIISDDNSKPAPVPSPLTLSNSLNKQIHVQLKDDPYCRTPLESLLAEKNCVILSAQSALNELKRRNKELEIKNSDLKSALNSAEHQIESLTDSLHSSESTYYEKLEKLANENTDLKSKLYSCETEIDYLRKRNSRPYASWNMEIVQLRAALDNMENERDALRNKCNEYQRLIKDSKK